MWLEPVPKGVGHRGRRQLRARVRPSTAEGKFGLLEQALSHNGPHRSDLGGYGTLDVSLRWVRRGFHRRCFRLLDALAAVWTARGEPAMGTATDLLEIDEAARLGGRWLLSRSRFLAYVEGVSRG